MDTVWCKQNSDIKDDEKGDREVRNGIAKDIKRAAQKGKLQQVNYVAQVGNRDAIGRIVTRDKEGYQLTHYDAYAAD